MNIDFIKYNETNKNLNFLLNFVDEYDNKLTELKSNYESKVQYMDEEYARKKREFDFDCQKAQENLKSQTTNMIQQAKDIKKQIVSMDNTLKTLDSHYNKAVFKKENKLKNVTSNEFANEVDYFKILNDIKAKFSEISKKYSQNTKKGALDNLNYIFSSKRKKDYEELIILKNTVDDFIETLEKDIKLERDEALSSLNSSNKSKSDEFEQAQINFKEKQEEIFNQNYQNLILEIEQNFNNLFPQEMIQEISNSINEYKEDYLNVTNNQLVKNELFYMGFVNMPILAENRELSNLIYNKLGELVENNCVKFPITSTIEEPINYFIEADTDNYNARNIAQGIMFSYLSSISATKLQFDVIDCEKHGNSVLPYLDLRKNIPELFGSKIYTSVKDAISKIEELNDKTDQMIQEILGAEYDDIYDYQKKHKEYELKIELLVLFDFPKGLTEENLSALRNIIINGKRCGIYTLILGSTAEKEKYGNEEFSEKTREIKKICASIDVNGDNSQMMLMDYENLYIPESSEFIRFSKDYFDACDKINNKVFTFESILDENLFERHSDKALTVPIGIGAGDDIVEIMFGKGSSHHLLVAGATGSGKSSFYHTLIISSMLHYSPDELNLYMMDFKGGTEFKIYDSYRLPHVKLLALDAMQEFGESILEDLIHEIEIRSERFKEYNVSKLSEYVQVSNKKMPRILVIIDEFQILFNEATNRKVANNCGQLIKRIVTEGRSYGINLMMATQSTNIISSLAIETGTMQQMRIRLGLKCGESDAKYLFGDEKCNKALPLMKGPIGTAVLNEEYTEEDNVKLRVSYCDDERKEKYLNMIAERYQDYEYDMKSFEGNKVVSLTDKLEKNYKDNRNIEIQIGEPIKIMEPLKIVYNRRLKHNALICGSNEKMNENITNLYILGILLNKKAKLYCIDGNIILDGEISEKTYYPEFQKFGDRLQIARNRSDIIRFIKDAYDFYKDAKKEMPENQIYILIKNFQYLDLAKKLLKGDRVYESEYLKDNSNAENEEVEEDDDPFAAFEKKMNSSSFENNSEKDETGGDSSKKLIQLVDDGSAYGINFIFTSLEYQSVKENMTYGEVSIRSFPDKYVFSLSDNDASSLVDDISLKSLKNNTVYYTDSIRNTYQVKPYVFPSKEELSKFIDELENN